MEIPTPHPLAWAVACALILCAAPPASPRAETSLDISDLRPHLSVLSDADGHYLVTVTFEGATDDHKVGSRLFYGDGRVFHEQRISGGSSSSADRTFSRYFWEPRVKSSLHGRGDAFTLKCDERETAFRAVPKGPGETLLANGEFRPALWKRHAYALSRDDKGTYYYVDRARSPPGNFDFRLYRGNRGSMRALKLINIVSDSEGDMFITRKGSLRLTWERTGGRTTRRAEWVHRRKKRPLVDVPVERNPGLIYRDLGMYDGQRLGTPCDDL